MRCVRSARWAGLNPAERFDKEVLDWILVKILYLVLVLPQDSLDVVRGTVAEPNPDDFGRESPQKAVLQKVRVFRHDHKTVLARKVPDGFIVSGVESPVPQMGATGVNGREQVHQSVGNILVEEKLHWERVRSLRSRSAAKARHALISSGVSSGKSRRISASVMPEAR